jgi:HAD superfamily hydrolase (TIGR01450 family)
MGVLVDKEHIMTSSYATALYLKERGAQGKTVFVVGERGIREELNAIGMKIVDGDPDNHSVDYVVVGMDRGFTYKKLAKAQQAIIHGAQFIATNRDATYPLEEGRVVPGGGAIVAAIEVASGKSPVLIGKPEPTAVEKLLEMANTSPRETAIIGDRLDTDVLVGKRLGAVTGLVLTGVTTREELNSAPPDLLPDIVVDKLPDLLDIVSQCKDSRSLDCQSCD